MNKKENFIISEIKNGDYEMFGQLVRTYQNPLFYFINRMIRNSDDAMDITQETFFKAYRSIRSFKFKSKFSTWLFQIGYHESVNFIKKNKRFFETERKISENYIAANNIVSVEKNEIARDIEKTLNKLKEDQRIALHLLYNEEKSYIEIAEIMKIPLNTVKSHIRRGKEALKFMLSENYDPDTILA